MAHQTIMTHSYLDDGWALLHTLLTKCCPFFGRQNINVASEITLLKFNIKIQSIHFTNVYRILISNFDTVENTSIKLDIFVSISKQ